jgi:phosphatidylinositol-3-phosphatase
LPLRGASVVALAVALLVAGCGATRPFGAGDAGSPGEGPPMPRLAHVWVIVFENRGYERIVGASDAPTLNDLIARGGLATRYHDVGHPSLPNYLALFSGSTQGVTDDATHDLDAPTIADQLEAAGLTWREYAENVPPGCFTGARATGGRDGDGTYLRARAPAISFTAISGHPSRCANIQDLTAFDPEAADYELIVPNMCHSMHDCPVAEGDAWLAGFAPRILDSPAFAAGGVLIITFDEGDLTGGDRERPATIVVSPRVVPATTSDVPHDHYSVVRTVEDGFGLPCLASSCETPPMSEFFTRP